MLAKRIIPCLDVKDGRVVKGVKFLQLKDAGDPVENAKFYDDQGADELVFLDITASYEKRNIMIEVVKKTAEQVFMPLTVGGGIRTLNDIHDLLLAGTDKVSINTAAVKDIKFVENSAKKFGSQCIVVAIDAKRKDKTGTCNSKPTEQNKLSWEVYTHGGRENTGIDVIEWARKVVDAGAGEILLTSMDCDGTKNGYDTELTKSISEAVSVPVIASGGAGALEHLYEVLALGKADAVLAASIFHYKEFTIKQTKQYLKTKDIPIRL